METAPLTLAHTHARNAVLETRKSNPVAASEEHDLAAGEFAAAAQNVSDREALRTLQLLENHHKKLAQILRFQHEHPASGSTTAEASTTPSPVSATPPLTVEPAAKTAAAPSVQDAQQQPPRLSGNTRLRARETSSIASNLASARGIPSHPRRASPASPTLSSQQAAATPTKVSTGESRQRATQPYRNRDRHGRASAPNQPWSPMTVSPTDITSQQIVPPDADESARQKGRFSAVREEPFQRFYSTFEGLISKLSAPLAFAGLPLGSDTSAQTDATRRKSAVDPKLDRQHATSDRPSLSAEPDVNRLFSPAALRAVRGSTGGAAGSPAESFYVVPTTGGTVSYAGILTRAEKEARRNSLEEVDEDFVDARETPSSPDMRQSLRGGLQGRATGRGTDNAHKLTSLQNPKTMEELQMENQALKHLSDTLSKRLHMWEVNAQSSSMALQQSLKLMHHTAVSPDHISPVPSPTAATPTAQIIAQLEQRIKALEEAARQNEKERERLTRENEKLRTSVARYRDRWEKLKEGAKTRRAEARSAGESSAATVGSNNRDGAGAVGSDGKKEDHSSPPPPPPPPPPSQGEAIPASATGEAETGVETETKTDNNVEA